MFAKWKQEVGKETSKFIPWQMFEDLTYLVGGIVGLTSTYLKTNNYCMILQSRLGSDNVEHKFLGICQKNSAPNTLNFCNMVAHCFVTHSLNFLASTNQTQAGVTVQYIATNWY